MAYEKHTWLDGEIITADKLGHIETGIDCLANCSAMWINQNPESSFAAQDIEIDTTPFAEFEFYFIIQDQDVWQTIEIRINKNRSYRTNDKIHIPVKYGNYERFVTIEDAKISFSDCRYGARYNDKLIPIGIHAFV